MANIDDGFSVDILVLGDIDDDQVLIAEGGFDPSGVGYEAPVGSLFLRFDSPTLYLKTGVADTGWSSVTTGGTDELVKTSSGDGTAGFLADKLISGAGLSLTETTGSNRTLTLSFDGVPRVQTLYVGKHGNDSNPGTTPELPKLTFGGAITTATGLTPSATNKITIQCDDGGTYTEDFTIPPFVLVSAHNASFEGNVVVSDNSEFKFQAISSSTGNVINKVGSTAAWISGETLTATGNANGIVNNDVTSILIANIRQLRVENGTGVLDLSTGTGHIHFESEDLYITGTGSGISNSTASGTYVGRISHILEVGGGAGNGTAIETIAAYVRLQIGMLDTTNAYNVTGMADIKLVVNEVDPNAQRIQIAGAATIDIIESNSLRWQNRSSNFTTRRTDFVAIDTSGGSVTMNLPNPASDGNSVTFQDALNTFGTNPLIIDAGAGELIDNGGSGTQQIVLDVSGTAGVLIYNASSSRWTLSRIQEEVAFSPSNLIYVTRNGDDTIGDGSFSNPFLTVKRGVQEALLIASAINPTTVKVLDGIYPEVNPIIVSGATSQFVQIQGSDPNTTFIEPTVNGVPGLQLESNTPTDGPSISNISLRGRNNGGTDYKDVAGSTLVTVTGDGTFSFSHCDISSANVGVDIGLGTITTSQRVTWTNGMMTLSDINFRQNQNSSFTAQVMTFGDATTTNVVINDTARTDISDFDMCGDVTQTSQNGINLEVNNFANVTLNSGLIHSAVTGIIATGSARVEILSTDFFNNTTDFNQAASTAVLLIQGKLSKTKQLISNGSNISLNYIDSDTGDFIVGAAEITGTPGKEFRVRDEDGRVAIGDAATNARMADGAVGGGRTLNVIDTNGNMRVWRFTTDPGQDPAIEFIKGTSAVADGAGRPGGPNPGNPAADVAAGTGTVWWDMFLQEEDYLTIRRRTNDSGSPEDERIRIYPDRLEVYGATDYDDVDQALIANFQAQANAVNSIEITNAATGGGPEIRAIGADTNVDIEVVPQGTGTAITPVGYDANIVDRSLITKAFADATYSGGAGNPAAPTTSVQYNNGGVFGGDANFTFDDTNDILTIQGAEASNHLTVYSGTGNLQTVDQAAATLYIQADGDGTYDGLRVKFQRSTAGISGWIIYNYDQATPNIQIIDEDDDPPYISFNTLAGGAFATPEFSSVFGARGTIGSRDPGTDQNGFAWHIGTDVTPASLISTNDPVMELDRQWLRIPTGTTAERPTSPANGMVRYNTTTSKLEGYEGGAWQDLVQEPVPLKEAFFAHNGTTTQVLTTTFVTAVIGTDVRSDASFSNTSGEVTVNKTGNFEVQYEISADSTGSRSSSECVLQVNNVDVPGTFAYGYHRNGPNGEDTAAATALVALTAGDVVRVRIREIAGTVVTLANASRLTIREID